MVKVTKEERQAMLKKCKELQDGIYDLLDFPEIRNYLTGRNDDAQSAVFKTAMFLFEVLGLFPEDPADDPIEEEDEEA